MKSFKTCEIYCSGHNLDLNQRILMEFPSVIVAKHKRQNALRNK